MKTGKNSQKLFFCAVLVVLIQLATWLTGTQYYLTQLTMSAYYGLAVIGLGVLMGYAGQISIGHAGFFAMGGYLSAALTTHNLLSLEQASQAEAGALGLAKLFSLLDAWHMLSRSEDIFGEPLLVVAPWAAACFALLLVGLVAYLLGIPVLKLKGHYLAMATLGFGTIVYRLFLAVPYFGEADGISDVPGFMLVPSLPGLENFSPVMVSGDMDMRIINYYLAAFILLACMALLLNLIDSRVGRGLRALHSSPDAAEAAGIHTARYKLVLFVLSAVFAAFGGILLTHYNGGIGPSEASVMKSVRYVALVAVGGMANLWGTLVMGVSLTFLSLRGAFGAYDDAVFGIILILVMLFAPQGILSLQWQILAQRCTALLGLRRSKVNMTGEQEAGADDHGTP